MKLQSKTVANIQLSIEDIREALAQYITSNGFAVTAQDLPIDAVEEGLAFDLEILADATPSTQVSKPSRRSGSNKKADQQAQAADGANVELSVESKPEPKVTQAETKPAEVVGTNVPDAEVEAYRAKKAAEAKAKEEAEKAQHVDEIIEDTFADLSDSSEEDALEDLEVVEQPVTTAKKTEDIFAEEPVVKAKTTTSIFDDETPAQTATNKVTENLFA